VLRCRCHREPLEKFNHTVPQNATHHYVLRFFFVGDRICRNFNIFSILNKFALLLAATTCPAWNVSIMHLKEPKVSRSLSSVKSAPSAFLEEKSVSAFLSDEDVSRLTGYRHRNKIIDALNGLSIPFILNARGHPLVLRSSFEPKGSAQGESKNPRRQKKEWKPL
jgi:hypothetical protein